MDIFETKGIHPMLIAEMQPPFNSKDFIFEVKQDGIRCIAYLDDRGADLRNKRNIKMLPWLPELADINKQIKRKCILDGEVVVFKNGITDFYEVQRRSLLTNSFKIQLAAGKLPAVFCVYDIIYIEDREVRYLPLIERKQLIEENVTENDQIAISRYIETYGVQFFDLIKSRGLEGMVAKRKDSLYWYGKRSKDWIKCKIMGTDDCVVCGYIKKPGHKTVLIIGQYNDQMELVFKGYVELGVNLKKLGNIEDLKTQKNPFLSFQRESSAVVWLEPKLVCIIEYMPSDKPGYRQATFKGLRTDKAPEECRISII